jgi:fibro-slime domain-containing protein
MTRILRKDPLATLRSALCSAIFFTSAFVAACSAGRPSETPLEESSTAGSLNASGRGGTSGTGGNSHVARGGTGIMVCEGDACPRPDTGGPGTCGDGNLTADEACDDANTADGDGCAASCLEVEPGYSCSPPGAACHVVALCGDALVASNEMCDDGNQLDGDGCSRRCKLELGYRCTGTPSLCSETVCGDDVAEGAESCDDGNAVPLDGCSATCQAEPDCSAGSCTSDCGDGLVIAEECDDGNTLDGDGCSGNCRYEPGFSCKQMPACEPVSGGCALRIPVVYRDFTEAHADFRCGGATDPPVIETHLDAEGKPVLVQGQPGCIASSESFSDWYRNREHNRVIPSQLVLFDNGRGGYVNRFGPNGEPWIDRNGMELDGTPLFLPIDDAPNAFDGARSVATIPPEYTGDQNWSPESDFVPEAGTHNFLFTTEVTYWFRFDAGFDATLDFLGDDDFWVFVNGILALDLGGLHVPKAGSVTLNASTAATYDLATGEVYAIKVFHAERNPTGSSFQLTLSGFENTPTECEPVCGDGSVSLGEECDDGENDGGYGECEPGCRVGARCGDGILQEGEDCDDGNRFEGDACGSACRELVIR